MIQELSSKLLTVVPHRGPAHGSYVLVVDDEAPIRGFLRRRLERWGYRVKEASRATEALEVMMASPASIVLLDIGMPGHDGFWLAERITARWKDTAIIIASGIDDVQTVTKSRAYGVIDYVTKPFEREMLLQALRRASVRIVDGPEMAAEMAEKVSR